MPPPPGPPPKPDSDSPEALGPLLRAVGLDAVPTGRDRTSAAITALAQEVLTLRAELAELRAALDRAQAQADHDALTPLFNRRAFERELRREIALAQRHGAGLCLIFLDLDRFKLVNDRFGHLTGDDVIIAVADLLRRQTRESDIVGRLGGDEFGVVLPQAALPDARRKAAALMQQIAAITVADADAPADAAIRLGASAGVAAWQPGMSAPALIEAADAAMFANKAERRAPG